MSEAYPLPPVFQERIRAQLGAEADDYFAALAQPYVRGLRLNPRKPLADPAALIEGLGEPVPWQLRTGRYLSQESTAGAQPLHEAGAYCIQEPSAMAAVAVLSPRPGERVLDLCAAPGGKSTQIADALEGRGLLVSNEPVPSRAKILSRNLERMGVTNGLVVSAEPEQLAPRWAGFFDAILVDAPCSGEGMFRKNEVACEEWSPENVQLCADRQDGILECAARMLVPGGRLVYSTCTFAPVENEGSISRFLAKHEEFEIVPIDKAKLGIPEGCDGIPACVENPAPGITGTLRLWPHKLRGEGHYAAVLQKKGKLPEGYQPVSATGSEKGIPAKNLTKDWAEYFNFAKETFSEEQTIKAGLCTAGEGFLAFGDNLYRMPERMPGVKGLKVLRPGLHLGTLKKNRFEPAHALALALRPEDVKHVWKLSVEEAAAYLKGQTFSAEGEKGWYLICVDDCSLGWGKLAGGIMKNHYPKGLRKG